MSNYSTNRGRSLGGGSMSRTKASERSIAQLREIAKQRIAWAKKHPIIDSELANEDKQAWWEYLRYYLPKNYKWATVHKYGLFNQDPKFGDLKNIKDIWINDYFELHGLPRVRVENRRVFVDDEPKLKISDDYCRKRDIFSRASYNPLFQKWKVQQLYYCQNRRCAWCKKSIKMNDSEVDHIHPLFCGGNNVSWNLVVACKKCNKIKRADTKGWNDTGEICKANKKPDWIKKNKLDDSWREILAIAKREVDDPSTIKRVGAKIGK